MPVTLNSNSAHREPQQCGISSQYLTIGLINNMADGALEATERQFLSLLQSASDDIPIRLVRCALPGVPRNEFGMNHIAKFYVSTEELLNGSLDGLIVTGREPLSPNLRDEPYWNSFAAVLEWAQDNTYSTVWSCLAAHAATLHMDGIGRVRSTDKRFGVFDCQRISDHPLIDGTSASFRLPHSRWNGLPEDALKDHGYSVLTRAAEAGVDTFVKEGKSLFVFFQGHPEYESNTLLLEYRRDVGRYLRGEAEKYPLMPENYFDRDIATALRTLQREVGKSSSDELFAKISRVLERPDIENTWSSTATCIYRNWLQYIRAQKQLRSNTVSMEQEAVSIPLPATAKYSSTSAVFASEH